MMYSITVYVPESHLNAVKNALFSAGAGRIGNYDSCAWQSLGMGQFRPLAGANPSLGSIGKIEQVPEYKIELVCAEEFLKPSIDAMKKAHPYETPAFIVTKINDIEMNEQKS